MYRTHTLGSPGASSGGLCEAGIHTHADIRMRVRAHAYVHVCMCVFVRACVPAWVRACAAVRGSLPHSLAHARALRSVRCTSRACRGARTSETICDADDRGRLSSVPEGWQGHLAQQATQRVAGAVRVALAHPRSPSSRQHPRGQAAQRILVEQADVSQGRRSMRPCTRARLGPQIRPPAPCYWGPEGGRAQRTQYLVPQTACEDQRAWFRACLCSPSGARGRGRRVRLPTTTRWQRGRLRDAP